MSEQMLNHIFSEFLCFWVGIRELEHLDIASSTSRYRRLQGRNIRENYAYWAPKCQGELN